MEGYGGNGSANAVQRPTVTIVTPSFNQGRFIRATIESVLSQQYSPLEYIIMDGGSTDETAAVAGEYGSRLTWISQPDRGQSHAINKGFRMARGEIVSWLNSDDVILPGAVEHAVAALERHPGAGAVYGEGYRIDAEGRVTGRFPATERFNLWKLVYLSDYVLQQTLYIRRAVLQEVGFLDETLHYGLDWDLLIRIAKKYRLEYVPEYMGCLREYPEAKSFAGGAERIRELRRILRAHTGLRFPPGFLAYALADWQARWMDRLEHHSPRLLRAPATLLSLGLYVVTAYGIMRTLRDSQGWYPDGWAGPRVHWMLSPGSGNIAIRGRVPPECPGLAGQKLRVYARRKLVREYPAGFGDFCIAADVGPAEDGPLAIELRASRRVRPRLGSEASLRPLCYQLYGVDWVG